MWSSSFYFGNFVGPTVAGIIVEVLSLSGIYIDDICCHAVPESDCNHIDDYLPCQPGMGEIA